MKNCAFLNIIFPASFQSLKLTFLKIKELSHTHSIINSLLKSTQLNFRSMLELYMSLKLQFTFILKIEKVIYKTYNGYMNNSN